MVIFFSFCLYVLTAVSQTQQEMVNVKKRPVQLRWHLSLKYSVPLMSPVIPGELDRNGCYRKGNNILISRNHACMCVHALGKIGCRVKRKNSFKIYVT